MKAMLIIIVIGKNMDLHSISQINVIRNIFANGVQDKKMVICLRTSLMFTLGCYIIKGNYE